MSGARQRPPSPLPRPSGGGNRGNKKGGGKRRGGGGGGGYRSDAQRDVGLVINPQLRELRNAGRGLRRDYRGYANQMGGLYGILGRELGDIGSDMGAQFTANQGDYTGGVESIMSALGQTTAPDQAGFLNTLGSFALAGQNELSSDANRETAWNASTRTQGGLESMVLQRNIRGDLQDALDDLRTSRQDIFRDRGPMLSQRMDQLHQQQFERSMALKELALRRQALNQADQNMNFSSFPWQGGGGGGGGPSTTPERRRRQRPRPRPVGTTISPGKGTGFDPRQMGR